MVIENYYTELPEVKKLKLYKLAESTLGRQGVVPCASINFVSVEEIHKLNKQYRNIDRPTDVLSFESDIEDDAGDIFICVDVARENNPDLEEELRLLTVHGMLHLCGYDHMNDNEAEIMEAEERACLKADL
ncbi:MAG: rRNA maturation RNase YbeY [Coriobacteriia bacterium]|nr:rRNA maturation RNase YbeY [Coriobacteriia bacterium]